MLAGFLSLPAPVHADESTFESLQRLTEAVNESRQERDRLRQLAAEQEQRLATATRELAAANDQAERAQREQQRLQADYDALTKDRSALVHQLVEVQLAHKTALTDLSEVRGQLDALTRSRDEQTAELARVRQGAAAFESRLTETRGELAVQQQAQDTLSGTLAQTDAEVARLRAALQEKAKTIDAAARQLTASKEAQAGLTQELDALRLQRAEKDRTIATMKVSQEREAEELRRAATAHEEALVQLRARAGALQDQVEWLQRQLADVTMATAAGTNASLPLRDISQPRPVSPAPDAARAVPAEIVGVNPELGFVALKGLSSAKQGARLRLGKRGQPPFEVEVTAVDREGIAVAYVQGPLPTVFPVQRGDHVSIEAASLASP